LLMLSTGIINLERERSRKMIEVKISTYKPCDIENPKFDEATRVHDWRNHISDDFKKIWKELPLVARFALVIMAEEEADREEWD